MKAETLKALQDSIAHWERMQNNQDIGEGPTAEFCALCERFKGVNACELDGEICPVRVASGRHSCSGTPYGKAYDAFYGNGDSLGDAAQAEIDFLKSLLPKESAQ